jgi:DNA-directed RNA polymerase specialized sigma24 family protein
MEELPDSLEALARHLAARYYPWFPPSRYSVEDLTQEARLSALHARDEYKGVNKCQLSTFAYIVIKRDMLNLLHMETAEKRGGRSGWDPSLEDYRTCELMIDPDSMFENAVINRVSAQQEIAELEVEPEMLVWAQLIEDGHPIYVADKLMGFTYNWGIRHVASIAQRHRRRKLKERRAAEHQAAVLARAERVNKSAVILPMQCR